MLSGDPERQFSAVIRDGAVQVSLRYFPSRNNLQFTLLFFTESTSRGLRFYALLQRSVEDPPEIVGPYNSLVEVATVALHKAEQAVEEYDDIEVNPDARKLRRGRAYTEGQQELFKTSADYLAQQIKQIEPGIEVVQIAGDVLDGEGAAVLFKWKRRVIGLIELKRNGDGTLEAVAQVQGQKPFSVLDREGANRLIGDMRKRVRAGQERANAKKSQRQAARAKEESERAEELARRIWDWWY